MKINYGNRGYLNIDRPSKELMQKFSGIPSSNINDLMNRLYCMRHELRPFNKHWLLGPAFTVKAPAGDNLVLHRALDLAEPGDIIVVDAEGCTDRSLMGEMMFNYSERRGIGGFVIDGAIRDSEAASRAGIPIYAKAVTPQGPYKNGPGEFNVPVSCGGQVVFPGDILVGDEDGIVVIRPEIAEELAAEAAQKHEKELKELERRAAENDTDAMVSRSAAKFEKILLDTGFQFLL